MKKRNGRQSKHLSYDFESQSVVIQKEKQGGENRNFKTGIIYVRVSTEEQKKSGGGIQGQTIDCERRAGNNKVKIMGYYKDEAITGQNLGRQGFLEALDFIEKQNKKTHNIDYFICGSTSRFSRSHKIGKTFEMVAKVEATGAKLVAVGNGGIQETDSEEGILTTSLNFIIDAIESKRGEKRVRIGQRGKIIEGLRPFPDVPMGYERIKETVGGKEIKYLIRKEPDATILSEGLKLFAEGIILTKQQLYEFLNEQGVKSNSKKNKTGKLHKSIIDKLLDTRKLLVYTGQLTYPDWGIDEIMPGKHPALIDTDTMHKILQRLNKDKDVLNHKKRAYDQDADKYPLKRILLCSECHKGVTKWKSKSKTGAYHDYYGCNTTGCPLYKKSIPRDDVHKALRQRLKQLQSPSGFMKLFEHNFKETRKTVNKETKNSSQHKEKKIQMITEEMNRIEGAIDNISDQALFKKKQQRRADLNEEKANLELEISDIRFSQYEFEKVYNDAKTVISNPLAIRDLQDVEIKQLLIRVCFNNKIYYTKKEGLHTPEISIIYSYIQSLSNDKTLNLGLRGRNLNTEFRDIIDFLQKIKASFSQIELYSTDIS